jgi:ABC-2 type transport system ATP-binding protein
VLVTINRAKDVSKLDLRSGGKEGDDTLGIDASQAVDNLLIHTIALTKRYGDVHALTGLTMDVRKGEVFGLLGPNGSGKTTTIRLLLGLIRPTAGAATVAGFDCWADSLEVREIVAYLPGELRLPGAMTGFSFLKYLSDLREAGGLDRAVAIAQKIMGLDLRRKVRNYSTGMKQKLALAQVFSDPVEILILDEPTSSLDPSARGLVLDLVAEARTNGQTVVFSGHVLPEVEQVADRVGIMRLGKLKHVEDMHNRSHQHRLVLARFPATPPESFPDELGLTVRERNGDSVLLLEHRGDPPALLSWLASQSVVDLAIGTDDLRTLYERFHGPDVKDDEMEVS